jgi:DNA repair protein RadA/Sms
LTVAKASSRYVCQSCGESFLRWEGQCRVCGGWNSLVEQIVREARRPAGVRSGPTGTPVAAVSLAQVGSEDVHRIATGIGELDRVLGGGIVPGSLILLGGEPGIGKSTLLLQVAAGLGSRVLYATGEESAEQVRLRARRLGLLDGPAGEAIQVLPEREIGAIMEVARQVRPTLLVVDSVQTAVVDDLDGTAGSVGQVREATVRLMELAKGEGIAVILVGHVTKDGSIAGPKTLEHLVDAVVTMDGERYAALRLVRATKNRFGSTDEVGVFEMAGVGLLEVADPSQAFLGDHPDGSPGSVVAPTLEGSRPILVEVQALVAPAGYGTPARKASGLDPNRLGLLVAVLGRRAGISLAAHDVYANLAGGLAVGEPGLDLPVAMALASSLRDRPVGGGVVAIGEVGLLGELRAVAGLERRLKDAVRSGFRTAIVPRPSRSMVPVSVEGMDIIEVATLRDAIEAGLSPRSERRGDALPAMLG